MHVTIQFLQIMWFVYLPTSIALVIVWSRFFYLRGKRRGYQQRMAEEQQSESVH